MVVWKIKYDKIYKMKIKNEIKLCFNQSKYESRVSSTSTLDYQGCLYDNTLKIYLARKL